MPARRLRMLSGTVTGGRTAGRHSGAGRAIAEALKLDADDDFDRAYLKQLIGKRVAEGVLKIAFKEDEHRKPRECIEPVCASAPV
jgi:hypothetical protein